MSSLSTLPKGDSAWLLRKSIQRIMQQVSVLETNIGSSTTGNSADTQVIFNDNGTLRGDTGLTYDKSADRLSFGAGICYGLLTSASATITGDLTASSDVLVNGNEKYVYLSSNYSVGTNSRVRFRAVGSGGGSGYGGDFRISTRAANNTWNTDALIVDSSANVGIGAAATSKLTVNGEISVTDNFALRLGSTQAGGATLLYNGSGNLDITPRSGFHTKLVDGNLIIGTSGKGIDFSAVTGGTGTATANVLNDYEEGTWTPVIKFGATTATQNATKATYTKIGRQVTCFVETYVINLNGGTGDFEMSGLPFTSMAMRSAQGNFLFAFMSATFPAGDKMAFINDSSTAFNISYFTGASGTASSLSNTDFTTSSYVYARLVYFV